MIPIDDLQFSTPPTVLGRGTYGQVELQTPDRFGDLCWKNAKHIYAHQEYGT